MKEKRLIATFITSAVTLVASLAVTFGVLMTLADPVVATGVTRFEYVLGAADNALVYTEGDTIRLKKDIVFQPETSVVWSNEEGEEVVWFNGSNIEDDIMFADESISTKLKVIPLKITNSYDFDIVVNLTVTYDKTTLLGKYTKVKLYDYNPDAPGFVEYAGSKTITIDPGETVQYCVVVYANDSANTSKNSINWGTDYENINVEVKNISVMY